MFVIDKLVEKIKSISGPNLFNPYTDVCPFHDKKNAAKIRERNLRQYLEVVTQTNKIIIGQSPGYIGCRRTGLPFTDNRHIKTVMEIYNIKDLKVATKSGKDKENSSYFIWKSLSKLNYHPFIWNVIPSHPFQENNQLSNRTPNQKDLAISKNVIKYLLERGGFKDIYAIGKIAEKWLLTLGYPCKYIRHPSFGGSRIFAKQISFTFQ